LKRSKNNKVKKYEICCIGGIAGMGSWICSYPFDLVKTKIQCEIDPIVLRSKYKENPFLFDGGAINCYKEILK